MTDTKRQARKLLEGFKGRDYVFGLGCLARCGELAAALGRRAAVIAGGFGRPWGPPIHAAVRDSLAAAGVEVAGEVIRGARPNAPREDVARLADEIRSRRPDVVVAVGGGSVIDAAKAAVVLASLGPGGPDIDECFGVGKVSALLESAGASMTPILAVQLASGSAAHLTKYSNVTDVASAQKKLIVDDAIVPAKALFDYGTSVSMSPAFTADGALDGVSHCLEVFYGLSGEAMARVRPVATLGIELIVRAVKAACADGGDLPAREALGLGTDLGGYAIMIGGTNGAHLTSFSLVDVLPHGRACALMNPYYTVFFAPAIAAQLRAVAEIFQRAGYLPGGAGRLTGRDLGLAVAEAMLALSRDIDFPTRLDEVPGFTDAHVARALAAAKSPQLEMKLRNMPVPLSAATVDDYMAPILHAARSGDFSLIRNMP